MNTLNFDAIAVCSKDLDFINFLEFCESKNIAFSNTLIITIGSGTRQQSVTTLVNAYKVNSIKLPDFDVYSMLSQRYLLFGNTSLLKKSIITLISYFSQHIYRFFILLIWKYRLRSFITGYLYLDMWRTKVPALAYISYKKAVIGDGGVSSEVLDLVGLWKENKGQFKVVAAYLDKQINFAIERKNTSGLLTYIHKLHVKILYGYSFRVLRNIEKNWPNESLFFSSYVKSDQISLSNNYSFFKRECNSFSKGQYVLVIGHPAFRTLNASVDKLKENSLPVRYNFHPRDKQLFKKNKKLKSKNHAVIKKLGWEVEDTDLSLESILISKQSIPSRIITYETSALVFITNILPKDVSIEYVKVET